MHRIALPSARLASPSLSPLRRPARAGIVLLVAIAASAPAQRIDRFAYVEPARAERLEVFPVRAPAPPRIDGTLDEAWWADAVVSEAFLVPGGGDARNPTRLKMAWDESHLYIAVVAALPGIEALVRNVPADTGGLSVWSDDCVDMTLSPDAGATRYQILVNANAALGVRSVETPGWSPAIRAAAHAEATSYTVEMAIPLADLGVDADRLPGALRIALGRADRTDAAPALSTAFGENWGDPTDAPDYVLGDRAAWTAARATGLFTREVTEFMALLDRERYPSFEHRATGRIVLRTRPGGEPLAGPPAIDLLIRSGNGVLWSHTFDEPESRRLDFDLGLAGLPPGDYTLAAVFRDGPDTLAEAHRPLRIHAAEAQRSGRMALRVTAAEAAMDAWPVRFGVPFPWGALDSDEHVRILAPDGAELPAQTRVVQRWSRDGSIQWLHVDVLPPVSSVETEYTLEYGPDIRRAPVSAPLQAEESADAITLDTGEVRMRIPRRNSPGIDRVWRRGPDGYREMMRADDRTGPYMIDASGAVFRGQLDPDVDVELEESGPLRAVVRVSGYHVGDGGERLGRFILRYSAWRGLPFVQLDHTFIITHDSDTVRYRNIGYSMPVRSRDYFFGTPRIHYGRLDGARNAYLLQRDDLHFRVMHDGQFRDEGGRAAGWMTAGQSGHGWLTVAVRDFWQQFPKEFEVERDRVHVHFWPAHGEPPLRTGDRLSNENAYHLWFAHEGEVLDFRTPEEALELFAPDTLEEDVFNARMASPVGVAKTHQMLLYFHEENWEDARSYSHNRVFQEEPAGIPDPRWTAASGAFGHLSARDPERFPEVERALDQVFEALVRDHEVDRDFGMWNFGDAHHNWNWAERRWGLHRIWYNNHHGWNRWPWILFARSGSKDLLDYARRNSRHAADIGHANYVSEEARHATQPKRKVLGGIHDYKGLVHWSRGDRLCYNSSADAPLWSWLVDGNRRGLSTALNHGASLIEDAGSTPPQRPGSGRMSSAVALYRQTWDNDYLEFIERHLSTLLAAHPDHPESVVYAPSFERFVEMTGDSRAVDRLVHWAERLLDDDPPTTSQHYGAWWRSVFTYAYLYSGDERFLGAAAHLIHLYADHLYDGEDPRFRGAFVAAPGNLHRSYFNQHAPYYLEAVRRHGAAVEPLPRRRTLLRALGREPIDGEERFVLRARLRQEHPGSYVFSAPVRGAPARAIHRAVLVPADGAAPIEAEITREGRENVLLRWTVDNAPARDYELIVAVARNFHLGVPVTHGQPDWREVYTLDPGLQLDDLHRLYFDLPRDGDEATLVFRGRVRPFEMMVTAPDGRPRARDSFVTANERGVNRTLSFAIAGEPHEQWSFMLFGFGGGSLHGFRIDGADAPFYFSAAPDKTFLPGPIQPSSP